VKPIHNFQNVSVTFNKTVIHQNQSYVSIYQIKTLFSKSENNKKIPYPGLDFNVSNTKIIQEKHHGFYEFPTITVLR